MKNSSFCNTNYITDTTYQQWISRLTNIYIHRQSTWWHMSSYTWVTRHSSSNVSQRPSSMGLSPHTLYIHPWFCWDNYWVFSGHMPLLMPTYSAKETLQSAGKLSSRVSFCWRGMCTRCQTSSINVLKAITTMAIYSFMWFIFYLNNNKWWDSTDLALSSSSAKAPNKNSWVVLQQKWK